MNRAGSKRRVSPLSRKPIEEHQCSLEVKTASLRRLPFFEDLSDEQVAQCCPSFHDHGYGPGQPVYLAGQPATRLFVVAWGTVKLVRAGPTGQGFLIDVRGEGDDFGSLERFGEDRYSDSAIAHV